MAYNTKSLQALDKQYLWHPFTQMKDWLADDILIIERAEGNYLYDTEGRKYLDGVSSLWCNVHGHRKKQIDAAIKQQLNKVAHSTMLGLSHPPAIELAEQLIKIAPPGLTRVFYSDNGSTAMEIALKMAFQYWAQSVYPEKRGTIRNPKSAIRKVKFLTFANAYHGDTIGSVSLGGIDLFHATYKPLLFETITAPAPYCYRCPDVRNCELQCLAEVERLIEKHRNELAAVVIEPLMQGAAGMINQPKGFIKRIRQLCTTYNILMIADEVATGFGRTGRMFALEHENVVPDIMAVAKGITGGYLPLAATLTTEKVFNAFLSRSDPYGPHLCGIGSANKQKTFFHGHTYTGNPLACAAALANLKIFRDEKVLAALQPKIGIMQSILKSFYKLNNVGDIRQVGFMAGIELVKNRWTREPYPYEARMGHKVILDARRHGVILRPLGDVIILMPPLSITIRDLIELLHITYHAIETITDSPQRQQRHKEHKDNGR